MNKDYLYHTTEVILYRPHHTPKALKTSGRVWQPLCCLASPAKGGCGLILLAGWCVNDSFLMGPLGS